MDYAKYSYLKLSELNLASQTQSQANVASSIIEFSSEVLNTNITSVETYNFGELYVFGESFLQCKALINSLESGKIILELLVDDLPILSEERTLTEGENQIILMKAYSPYASANINVSMRIKIVSDSFACTLTNCVLAAWGSVQNLHGYNAIQMRVLSCGENILFSYNHNNKIYITQTALEEKSFLKSDFTPIASGISHCFATDKNDLLYLFRVDSSGNLFYSKYSNILDETKIDTNVSVVFARKCTSGVKEDILICYIKDGIPMFRCMTNQIIGSSNKFKLPSGEYTDIEIVDAKDARQMFVICTHKNLSNYILYSIDENTVTEFVESLNASIASVCTRYVNVAVDKEENNFVDNLNVSFLADVTKWRVNYEDFLSDQIVENLNIGMQYSTSLYEIVEDPEVNYEMSYSQLDQYVEGQHRITFGADCADWIPATMDVNGTGTIIDTGGILEKWPFNKIKPCLVEDGKNLGYLNPNDYSLFEDGSPADITNPNYDVMVEFPKIYYKIEEDWDGEATYNKSERANLKVYVSNKAKEGYVCHAHTRQGVEYDSIYVCAYENFVSEDNPTQLLCCSGVKSKNNYSHGYILKHFNEFKGAQYGTFHIHIATMLQILSMLLFKEWQGSYTYGNGYRQSTNPVFADTGVSNTKGMFYGLFVAGTHNNKLFGLENILGHCHTILDGLHTTNDLHWLVYDPTDPNCVINYDATNYKEYAPNMASITTSYLVRVSGNNNYGFVPVSHVPIVNYSKPYYNCQSMVKKPSQWGSYYDKTSEYASPYMIYSFGGYWKMPYTSLFTYVSLYDQNDATNNAERLVCYPNSRLS